MTVDILDRLIERLPRHPHILGKEKYRNSAVMILIVEKDDSLFIVFEKRSAYVSQPGEICLPGGRVDPEDDNSRRTALREVQEEIGLDAKDIVVLGAMDSLVNVSGVTLDIYIGFFQMPEGYQWSLNKAEVDELYLVPIQEVLAWKEERYSVMIQVAPYISYDDGSKETLLPAKELGLPERYETPWPHNKKTVYVYRSHFVLWGMTGEIIHYFRCLVS